MADPLAWGAQLIELGGAVIVTWAVLRALAGLAGGRTIEWARLQVIAGTVGALGFKTAATLLKALALDSWHAIGAFAAIFALRTIIKRLFLWERAHLTPSRLQESQSPVHATMLRDGVTNSR